MKKMKAWQKPEISVVTEREPGRNSRLSPGVQVPSYLGPAPAPARSYLGPAPAPTQLILGPAPAPFRFR